MSNTETGEQTALTPGVKSPIAVAPRSYGGLIPVDLEQLWRMATMIYKSGFAPKGMQSPEAVAVAIQMGLEVGLSPMQAVQNIAVINGRPSLWGDAALGLVQASGLLEEFHEWEEGERFTNEWVAKCRVKRKGDKEPTTRQFEWSDAQRADLDKKSPSPWQTYPQRMLQMRARSWALRDKFADVLRGLQLREEVIDAVELRQAANGSYQVQEKTEDRLEALKQKIAISTTPDEFKECMEEAVAPRLTTEKRLEEDADKAVIAAFNDLKTPGLSKWLSNQRDNIPQMSEPVRQALNDKCKRVWNKTLDEALELLTPREPATTAVEGQGPMVVCPDDSEPRYESYCTTECAKREGCPAFD